MPALCYMQCCYEVSVYKWFITHKHTNDLLNTLLKCIKFYLYIHIVYLLTYLNCFIHQTYSQLFINCMFFYRNIDPVNLPTSSPVSIKKHTVNKKLTICLMDKTV